MKRPQAHSTLALVRAVDNTDVWKRVAALAKDAGLDQLKADEPLAGLMFGDLTDVHLAETEAGRQQIAEAVVAKIKHFRAQRAKSETVSA